VSKVTPGTVFTMQRAAGTSQHTCGRITTLTPSVPSTDPYVVPRLSSVVVSDRICGHEPRRVSRVDHVRGPCSCSLSNVIRPAATPASVTALFIKRAHGEPMLEVPQLRLAKLAGVSGDVNPAGTSPRQVCIALANSLRVHRIRPEKSRANIILDGEGTSSLRAGALISAGTMVLRVTMPCEPCAYGAQLADVPTREFRQLIRYLAIVIGEGTLSAAGQVQVDPGEGDMVPPDFRSRCAWALDQIPVGRVVTSTEFLHAIGASRSYARVLPRWLEHAGARGKPIHRVLTATLRAPSWAPDAFVQLETEGTFHPSLADASYPLTNSLWFNVSFAQRHS
jgi:alkylated DNA nucleotide flippase Atl1